MDDSAFLWEHAIFGPPLHRNPLIDRYETFTTDYVGEVTPCAKNNNRELRTGRAARGPGLTIPIFLTGRAGPSSRNLGPARPGSFPVGRVVCRGLCLALPFPSV
jgi:hypothetical protein